MSKLRQNWFVVLNAVMFIASLAFYFLVVAGLEDKKGEIESSLNSTTNQMRQLAVQRPTAKWIAQTEASKASLEADMNKILSDIQDADRLIEGFISTEDAEAIVYKLPAIGERIIYKESLIKKWQELADQYCQKPAVAADAGAPQPAVEGGDEVVQPSQATTGLEGKPFMCSIEVPKSLEPVWLRSDENPSSDMDVSESQKRFWISKEIFSICASAGILEMQSLQLNEAVHSALYQFKGQATWQHRDMVLVVVLEAGKPLELMKKVNDSPLLFRVTGMQQDNITSAPAGVRSNVEYLHFTKGPPAKVRLTLHLRHFDHLNPGQVALDGAAVEAGAAGSGSAPASQRRNRSRR